MRKIAEKVSVVAQICITLVFVITTLLYMFNVIPENSTLSNNGILATLVAILAVVYLLLSGYLVYVNFSEREALHRVLLHCDSESATHASVKVVKSIVRSCAKKVEGLRVKKVRLTLDEKNGLAANLKVDVAHNVSESIDMLRCLITDAFKNTLGVTFNSVNFVIRRLKSKYKPDVDKAERLAKTLTQQRELSADIYDRPFRDNCEQCAKADENDEKEEPAAGEQPHESEQAKD